MDAVVYTSGSGTRRWDLHWVIPVTALVGFAALVIAANLIGSELAMDLRSAGGHLKLGATPLFGRFEALITPGIAAPIAVATLVIIFGPRLTRSLSWHQLLVASFCVSATWLTTLALSNGSISAPLEGRPDYLAALPQIAHIGDFVSNFGERLGRWPVHVEGHPPGMVVLLFGMASIGLGGSLAAATLIIAAGSTIAAAAMIAVRAVADEATARRGALFLVLAPAAVWIATSADGLFAAVVAWALATFTLAVRAHGLPRRLLGATSGVLFGSALFFSYGAAPFALVFVAIAVWRRAVGPALAAVAGAFAVTATWAVNGFWWFDGLRATIERYGSGVAADRPFSFFVWANLAAFSLAVGPAAVLGAVYLKRSRLWILSGTVFASLILADMSGLSKGEVERIWLPFAPWIIVLAASIPRRFAPAVLAGQATLAVAIQTFVRTPW